MVPSSRRRSTGYVTIDCMRGFSRENSSSFHLGLLGPYRHPKPRVPICPVVPSPLSPRVAVSLLLGGGWLRKVRRGSGWTKEETDHDLYDPARLLFCIAVLFAILLYHSSDLD